MRIAALLTTFNRREKTLSCLLSLSQQRLPSGVSVEIFLTDDASSDGTAEAVEQVYPLARVFAGSGNLYWAGGMRFTWKKAMLTEPDYYLLLNDDTILEPGAVQELLRTSGEKNDSAISVGSTADPLTRRLSYGGRKLQKGKTWNSALVYHDTQTMACDLAHANILLVPAMVVKRIGILAEHFTHCLADYDYTLKARHAGIPMRVAPGILGWCTDDHGNNWRSSNTSLAERIRYLKSPKGLAYSEYLRFIRDHFPLSYVPAFIKLWLKTIFPFIWDLSKRQKAI